MKTLGRMIYSMIICVKYFFFWGIITFFLMIPYGLIQENLSRPNVLVKTLDEKYDLKFDENGSFQSIANTDSSIYYAQDTLIITLFKNSYFHIFGELFIDEKFDPEDPGSCRPTLSRPGPGSTCPDYVRKLIQ